MPVLIVHGGAGGPPEHERAERRAAVERALDAGWAAMGQGALEAVVAAVRHLEDEPVLNAGIGASLNLDGEVELDAGVMEGTTLRAGAVGAVRDARHPIDLARAVMDDGRHVLLVGGGASRFARERGVETCGPEVFVTERQRLSWRAAAADTVGAVARDAAGRTAVAVSTGGMPRKWPGRLGDTPLPGAGFYADDRRGVACGTGVGEGFMRLCLCHLAVVEMAHGMSAGQVAPGAVEHLARRVGGSGGVILIDAAGRAAAAHNTPFMAWAQRTETG
jgi:L-asparaginase / beta-aspartyl-peptidase